MPATEARRFTDLRHIPLTPSVIWTLYLAASPVRHRSPAAATLADEFVAEAAGSVS
jgi:hypothetical protein